MRARRGFTLMEVMIALAILITTLAILMESQATAVMMTEEAEKILIGTQLAQEKLAEVQFLVENEGFQDEDVYEEGDFEDFGDEAMDMELRDLEQYHFEFLVTEIDLSQAADLSSMMSNVMGSFAEHEGGAGAADAAAAAAPPQLPISMDMVSDMLNPFIREVKVRVWWGEDSEEAEEAGDEIVLTTHMINPHGNMLAALGGLGGVGGQGGQGGQGGPGGRGPGGRGPGRGPTASPAGTPFGGASPFGGAAPFGGGGRR